MSIVKYQPIKKFTNGVMISVCECSMISEQEYTTDGESLIVVNNVPNCTITLSREKTDNITIKSNIPLLTIKPDLGKIDEEFEEIEINKGVAITFWFLGGTWWVIGSDGIKQT